MRRVAVRIRIREVGVANVGAILGDCAARGGHQKDAAYAEPKIRLLNFKGKNCHKTYPAAQLPASVPPLDRHSDEVKQVPFRNWAPDALKTSKKYFKFQAKKIVMF